MTPWVGNMNSDMVGYGSWLRTMELSRSFHCDLWNVEASRNYAYIIVINWWILNLKARNVSISFLNYKRISIIFDNPITQRLNFHDNISNLIHKAIIIQPHENPPKKKATTRSMTHSHTHIHIRRQVEVKLRSQYTPWFLGFRGLLTRVTHCACDQRIYYTHCVYARSI